MQISFGMYEDRSRRQKPCMLDEIIQIVNFKRIGQMLEEMYASGKAGRPPIPPLILFKALLLESWYDLSDVEVVQEIHDRRSFERFVGEEVRNYHLDDTTLVKFRNRLRNHGLMKRIWDVMDLELQNRGLVVKRGVIIDSTLVKGATRPSSRRSDGSLVDGDIGRTVREGEGYEGMKVQIGMDSESRLIRGMGLRPITEHDHRYFKPLIPEGTEVVYADKAYSSGEHRMYLAAIGVKDGIIRKRPYRQLQTEENRVRNKMLSQIRGRIEAKMDDLKRWCSMDRLRYYGRSRNELWMWVCGLACNWKRMVRLVAA